MFEGINSINSCVMPKKTYEDVVVDTLQYIWASTNFMTLQLINRRFSDTIKRLRQRKRDQEGTPLLPPHNNAHQVGVRSDQNGKFFEVMSKNDGIIRSMNMDTDQAEIKTYVTYLFG